MMPDDTNLKATSKRNLKSIEAKVLIGILLFEMIAFPSLASAPKLPGGVKYEIIKTEYNSVREMALGTGLVEENSLGYWIIFCESSWNPKACNRHHNCREGMGLFQFISSTWNETIVRMSKEGVYMPEKCWAFISFPVLDERSEAIFDGECNLLAGLWLLEADGMVHWEEWSGSCFFNK